MSTIRVIDRDGVAHDVEALPDSPLMETLRELDYGVAAICGGMCSCATCHVYVDEAWLDRLPDQHEDEDLLLGDLEYRRLNSRLSCQIPFDQALAGITVTLPPEE